MDNETSTVRSDIVIDGMPLTTAWINSQVRSGQIIPLIKAYRLCTNKGLRDAKDAIDSVRYSPVSAVVELFAPYLPDYKPAKKAKVKTEKDRILSGVKCACTHWKTMGFSSIYDACSTVIRNMNLNG